MNLIVGNYICNLCRKKIREKSAQSAPECSSKLDDDQETTPECSPKLEGKRIAKRKIVGAASKEDICMALGEESSKFQANQSYEIKPKIDVKSIIDGLNEVFSDAGLPEIDKSQLRYKKYATETLNNFVSFLSKNVFTAAEVSHDSEEIIEQLKSKFATASTRCEKVQILSILPQSWTASKIQQEFNTTYYLASQTKELVAEQGIFCSTRKKLGPTRMDEKTCDIVKQFYRSTEISRECPGMREYVTITDDNNKVGTPRKLVLMNLKEAHELFKIKYPNLKIGLSKFAELRPPECVLALEKYGTHQSCVCQYHENFKQCFSSLKRISLFEKYKTYRDLLEDLICDKKSDDCYFARCEGCSRKISRACYQLQGELESRMMDRISIKQWANLTGKHKIMFFLCQLNEYKNTKHFLSTGQYNLETIDMSTDGFAIYIENQITNLLEHDFIAKRQSSFFETQKKSIKPNEFLVICDFSENYAFMVQNAIQSFHWVNKQCTIHPFVVYYKNGDNIDHISVVVIAESLKHDVTAVYLFQKRLLAFMQQKFNAIEKIEFFSDGAGGQYKNKKNFFNISQYKEKYGIDVEWHCFATSHGKSPCDGVGGTFKRNARRESLRRTDNHILNSQDLYTWASNNDSSMIFIHCT